MRFSDGITVRYLLETGMDIEPGIESDSIDNGRNNLIREMKTAVFLNKVAYPPCPEILIQKGFLRW
jgi:hypothetical protein